MRFLKLEMSDSVSPLAESFRLARASSSFSSTRDSSVERDTLHSITNESTELNSADELETAMELSETDITDLHDRRLQFHPSSSSADNQLKPRHGTGPVAIKQPLPRRSSILPASDIENNPVQVDEKDNSSDSEWDEDLEIVAKGKKRRQFSDDVKAKAVNMYLNEKADVEVICNLIGCGRRTLFNWVDKWKTEKSFENKKRGGRPRKLTHEETQKLLQQVDDEPRLIVPQMVALVDSKVSEKTVRRTLKRANYTRKRITPKEPKYPTPDHLRQTRAFWKLIQTIPEEERVYMDESFTYGNESSSMGYAKVGKRAAADKNRHAARATIWAAITIKGWVHEPFITSTTANHEAFVSYVRDILVPHLKPGQVVLWDQLGKGNAKNPVAQHFAPIARQLIEAAGCRLVILPAKGKHFDPIELAFNTIKTYIRNSYTVSVACKEKRIRNEIELRTALMEAAKSLKEEDFQGFFRCRAGRADFDTNYPGHDLDYESDVDELKPAVEPPPAPVIASPQQAIPSEFMQAFNDMRSMVSRLLDQNQMLVERLDKIERQSTD